MKKTLYLWDLADTLFYEQWNAKRTGFPSYDAWVEAHFKRPLVQISDREYEEAYKVPYKEGWYFQLDAQPGFQEVLEFAKENAIFTTGLPIQLEWRAQYLNPKVGFRIQDFFKIIHSTFDYGETNKKEQRMLTDILRKVHTQGYNTIVYTDDKEKNCKFFLKAAQQLAQEGMQLNVRVYWVRNDHGGLRIHDKRFAEIGNLFELKQHEEELVNL